MNRPAAKAQRRQRDYENWTWSCGLTGYRAVLRPFIAPATWARILDVGCGPGRWCAAATEEGIVAVGIDTRMTARALRERDRHGYRLVRFWAEELPFRAGSFNIVPLELGLPYDHVDRCLLEVARVLEENGRVHCVCHWPGYYLSAAWNEALRLEATALRRAAVLLCTLLHRAARLESYRFETFQTSRQVRRAPIGASFWDVEIGLGGQPFDRKLKAALLPVFSLFRARGSRASS